MIRGSIRPMSTSAPKAVPNPGSTSQVGPSGAAPKPRIKNTRDYGKADPSMPMAPAQGPASPFGDSSSRLGGI